MKKEEIKQDIMRKFADIKENLEVLDTSKLNPIFETWVHETKDMIKRFTRQSTAVDFRINKCCAICATLMEIDNPEIVIHDFINDKGEIVNYSMYSSPDVVVNQMLETAQNNLIAALHDREELDRTYSTIYEIFLKCFPPKPDVEESTVTEEMVEEVMSEPEEETSEEESVSVEETPVEEETQLELTDETLPESPSEEGNTFAEALRAAAEAIKEENSSDGAKNLAEEILETEKTDEDSADDVPNGWVKLRIEGMPPNGYIMSKNGTIVDRFTGRTLRPYKNHGKTIYRFRNFHTKSTIEMTEEEVWKTVSEPTPKTPEIHESADMLLVDWIPGIPKDKYKIFRNGKMMNVYDDRFIKSVKYNGRDYYNLTDKGYRGVPSSKVNAKIVRVYVDDLLKHFV